MKQTVQSHAWITASLWSTSTWLKGKLHNSWISVPLVAATATGLALGGYAFAKYLQNPALKSPESYKK